MDREKGIKMTAWFNPAFDLPPEGVRVLCVKETKNGNRDLCFGAWYGPSETYPDGHWVTSGSCSNVVHWTLLPKMPKKMTEMMVW